jgi:hypothetical protein
MAMAAKVEDRSDDELTAAELGAMRELIALLPELKRTTQDLEKIAEGCPVARHILGK